MATRSPSPKPPRGAPRRHASFLPAALADRYASAAADPDLTSLRDELALLDMRIGQLLEANSETASTQLWQEARRRFEALKRAGAAGPRGMAAARLALQQLEAVLQQGLSASAIWDQLPALLDLRRKLTSAETKRTVTTPTRPRARRSSLLR
jgi:hypothetical protein